MGPRPTLEPHDAVYADFYWSRLRPATQADQPCDPVRAIQLWERLYGPLEDPEALLDSVLVIDSEMARTQRKELDTSEAELDKTLRGR